MKPIIGILLLIIYTFNANAAVMLLCSSHQQKNSSAIHSHSSTTVHACCITSAGGKNSCAMIESCQCTMGAKKSGSEGEPNVAAVFAFKIKAISTLYFDVPDIISSQNHNNNWMSFHSNYPLNNYQSYPLRI